MDKIRGVNLGNWLVLEKWMGDSPLSESEASEDDHDLVSEYSNDPDLLFERLEAFRDTYVTKEAIAWLKGQGCNLVRIPIPYHICGSEHHASCSRHLNNLFDWCDELGVGILIDLHTTQGGHNGSDCGGYIGMCTWHQSEDRVRRTIALLRRLAGRYAGRPSFWGIEPLNEPACRKMIENQRRRYGHWRTWQTQVSTAPTRKFLMQFYEDFYHEVKPVVGDGTRVVLHDHWFLPVWKGFMPGRDIVIDTHRYPSGKWFLKNKDIQEHVRAVGEIGDEIAECAKHHPVICGEWSLGYSSPYPKMLDDTGKRAWLRAYADAQIDAWDRSLGGCFWSLRANSAEEWAKEGWSFVDCVRDGWIDLRHGL